MTAKPYNQRPDPILGDVPVLDARGRILHRKAAPRTEAIFGFTEEGAPAAVFLTETGELYHWRGNGWQRVPLGPDQDGDEIIAVAGTRSGMISLVFHRDGACWLRKLSARSGRVRFESLLPGVSEPLLLLPGGALLYADGNRLVVRDARGAETRVEIPAPVAGLERMGKSWVHGLDPAGGAGMAIRVSGAGIEFSQLPGVRP